MRAMSISPLGKIKSLLALDGNTNQIAASFAVGIFVGLSPLLGVHTILALGLIYIFRLNLTATMTGVYITNPLTIIPIYTFSTWTGAKMLGMEFFSGDMKGTPHLSLIYFWKQLRYLIKPFFVGSTIVAILASLVLYLIVSHILRKVRNAGSVC